MKKLFVIVVCLLFATSVFSQTTPDSIYFHNDTPCDIHLRIYSLKTSSCSSSPVMYFYTLSANSSSVWKDIYRPNSTIWKVEVVDNSYNYLDEINFCSSRLETDDFDIGCSSGWLYGVAGAIGDYGEVDVGFDEF